jgi:hypothetical protein
MWDIDFRVCVSRNQEKIKAAKKEGRRRKRGTTASDEEYLAGTDSDDDFYDRTTSGGTSTCQVVLCPLYIPLHTTCEDMSKCVHAF